MGKAEETLLQLYALHSKERDHEDSFAGSFRLGLGRGRYSYILLAGAFGEWSTRLANRGRSSPTSSGHAGGLVLRLPPSYSAPGSLRLGSVYSGGSVADLLQSVVLLGDSVPRRLESHQLAFRLGAPTPAGDHARNLVLSFPLVQAAQKKIFRYDGIRQSLM